jgi:mannose-6-phosphate isomerase
MAEDDQLALEARARRALDWLFVEALPVWAEHGRNPHGGWFDRLDDHYRPDGAPMRMRVQARQTYVFAEAGRLGWRGPWREMVEHGVEFMTGRGARPDGLVSHTFASEDAAVIEWGPDLYDQAFALFAYGSAYAATRDPRAKAAGVRLLEALQAVAHPEGGFREFDGPSLKANPQMHMLEAALVWVGTDPDPRWRALATELGRLCAQKLVDRRTGALHEHFVDGWRRAPLPEGDCTEPGHHFEWGWLLTQADLGTPPELPVQLATRAERLGVDHERNVAMNAVDAQGGRIDADARLWPQTERLKAALMMRSVDPQLWTPRACEAHDGLFQYIDGAPRGLWKDLLRADGSLRSEPAPASSLYHITCAISELVRSVGLVKPLW